MNSLEMIELQASYPTLCARHLEGLDTAQMAQRFGPDYQKQYDTEVMALAAEHGIPLPDYSKLEAA